MFRFNAAQTVQVLQTDLFGPRAEGLTPRNAALHGRSGVLRGPSKRFHGLSKVVQGLSNTLHGPNAALQGLAFALHGPSGSLHGLVASLMAVKAVHRGHREGGGTRRLCGKKPKHPSKGAQISPLGMLARPHLVLARFLSTRALRRVRTSGNLAAACRGSGQARRGRCSPRLNARSSLHVPPLPGAP